MNETEHFLTVAEYAAAMRINPVTVRKLIRDGQLPHLRVGGQWRIPASVIKVVGGTASGKRETA